MDNSTNQNTLVETAEDIKKCVVPIYEMDATGNSTLLGTGFFVRNDGLIATAAHIAASPNLHAGFRREFLNCKIVAKKFTITSIDNNTKKKFVHEWDVGLLRIPRVEESFPCVKLSKRVSLRVGEHAGVYGYYDYGTSFAIGDLYISSPILTLGVIAASFSVARLDNSEVIACRTALDITAGPGSSGSPAFVPASGEVFGVASCGKGKTVLRPPDSTGKPGSVHIPSGILECEPIAQLAAYLEKYPENKLKPGKRRDVPPPKHF